MPEFLVLFAVLWVGLRIDDRLTEYQWIFATSVVESYIFSWTVAMLQDMGIVSLGTIDFFGLSWYAVVFGTLLGIRWTGWLFEQDDLFPRLTSLLVLSTFGTGTGVLIVTALHPSQSTIEFLYQFHISFVLSQFDFFFSVLGIVMPVLPRELFVVTWEIFVNNFLIGARAAVFGAAGGFILIFVPLVFVIVANVALVWGAFSGLLLRSILWSAGSLLEVFVGPAVALFSAVALHALPEVIGIVGMGAASVYGIRSFLNGDLHYRPFLVFGGLIFLAAVIEVWLSSGLIAPLVGSFTVESFIVPVTDNSLYIFGVLSSLLWITGWGVVVVRVTENVEHRIQTL